MLETEVLKVDKMEPSEDCPQASGTSVLLTAILLGVGYLTLTTMPGDPAWAVPVNIPHQGGYAAGTPGLRPVNLLESCFLNGSPYFSLLYWGSVFLTAVSWRRKMTTMFAPTLIVVVALTLVWADNAPALGHRCQSPTTLCASNMKNLRTALEMYKESHGHEATTLSSLCPDELRVLPKCPLTGVGYEFKVLSDGYSMQCQPHPPYFAGNDSTVSGKNYLSLRPGGELLRYSSEHGLSGKPTD